MKLLVLLSRIPYPLEKGDKLRAFNQIRLLSEHHSIILCALTDHPIDSRAREMLSIYCSEVHFFKLKKLSIGMNVLRSFFNGAPLQTGYFFNHRIYREIRQIIAEHKPDHIYCQLIRMAEYARVIEIRKTLDYQDALSKGMERRMLLGSFITAPVFRMEFKRLLCYERSVFNDFDNKVIISEADRDCIDHRDRASIKIVPNGIDHEYFKPQPKKKDFDLLFTGNMSYPPNVNCVEYVVNRILPALQKLTPGIRMLIAGAAPVKKVRALASENVVVSGWVEDIRDSYSRSKIFIAPMQIGTGMQNKILEAMAMKVPCITSKLANNAIMAKEGEEILIGNSPDEYAAMIVQLLRDYDLYHSVADKAYSMVVDKFSWKSSVNMLENIILSSRQ